MAGLVVVATVVPRVMTAREGGVCDVRMSTVDYSWLSMQVVTQILYYMYNDVAPNILHEVDFPESCQSSRSDIAISMPPGASACVFTS